MRQSLILHKYKYYIAHFELISYNQRKKRGNTMSDTALNDYKIDAKLKENAEKIFKQFGISGSEFVSAIFEEVLLAKSIEITKRSSIQKPLCLGNLTDEQLEEELLKGIRCAENGDTISLEDSVKALKKKNIQCNFMCRAYARKDLITCL